MSVRAPDRTGVTDGLAWDLHLPSGAAPLGGVVVLHGAGSRRTSHHDFAAVAADAGLAALTLDARGHGDSPGPLDGRALADVATAADVLRGETGDVPVALRGSSMGGYLALAGAPGAGAFAVCAVCPAPAALLAAGMRSGRFDLVADVPAITALLEGHDLLEVVPLLEVPVLVQHAEGDESVPISASRELAAAAPEVVTLQAAEGGDHRSLQHDPAWQRASVDVLLAALP